MSCREPRSPVCLVRLVSSRMTAFCGAASPQECGTTPPSLIHLDICLYTIPCLVLGPCSHPHRACAKACASILTEVYVATGCNVGFSAAYTFIRTLLVRRVHSSTLRVPSVGVLGQLSAHLTARQCGTTPPPLIYSYYFIYIYLFKVFCV